MIENNKQNPFKKVVLPAYLYEQHEGMKKVKAEADLNELKLVEEKPHVTHIENPNDDQILDILKKNMDNLDQDTLQLKNSINSIYQETEKIKRQNEEIEAKKELQFKKELEEIEKNQPKKPLAEEIQELLREPENKSRGREIRYVDIVINEEHELQPEEPIIQTVVEAPEAIKEFKKPSLNDDFPEGIFPQEVFFQGTFPNESSSDDQIIEKPSNLKQDQNKLNYDKIFSKIDDTFNKTVNESELKDPPLFNEQLKDPDKRYQKIRDLKGGTVSNNQESINPKYKDIGKTKQNINETRSSLDKKIDQLKKQLGGHLEKDDHNLESDLNKKLHVEKYVEPLNRKKDYLKEMDLKQLTLYELIIYLNQINPYKFSDHDKKRVTECIHFKIKYIKNLISKNNDEQVIIAAKNVLTALINALNKIKAKGKGL